MKKNTSSVLIGLSILTALVAGYVSMSGEAVFKLAGTQWMLIAIILALYGICAKMKME